MKKEFDFSLLTEKEANSVKGGTIVIDKCFKDLPTLNGPIDTGVPGVLPGTGIDGSYEINILPPPIQGEAIARLTITGSGTGA